MSGLRIAGLIAALIIAGNLVIPACADCQSKFSDTWMSIKKQHDWSRQQLLEEFCQKHELRGMSRARVLEFLGTPEITYEQPAMGIGSRSRFDEYQISAGNDRSFRINYDERNLVTGYAIENDPCQFNMYLGPSLPGVHQLTLEKLNRLLFSKYTADRLLELTAGQLAGL